MNPNRSPSPKPDPTHSHLPPFPFPDPPPPPSYNFHMLERRTFPLSDGSVLSYFALPPNYQEFPPFSEIHEIYIKRKYIDECDLKMSFLHFVKVIFEDGNLKKKYLGDGEEGNLRCLACERSEDIPDMHALVMHAYNPESAESADSLVDHLGFHKALCILMGWNFLMPPDISKLYQKLPADQATANQDDLILWPPIVIIHNTTTGGGREERNRTVDNMLRALGFSGGKSKSLYSRYGHTGITLVKFTGDESGLKEAMQLAGHFEKDGFGRRGWGQAPSSSTGKDDDSNPHPKTGENNRILYGYLATVMDVDKVDYDTRKNVIVESRKDHI